MTWAEAVALAEGWAWRVQLPLVRRLTIGEARAMFELAKELEDARENAREIADSARMESESEPVDWRWP